MSRDAVYRVPFEVLAEHGLEPQPADSLQLVSMGEPVPVWLEGVETGRFGPGSALVFVGQHLRGTNTWFDEHSRHRSYRLQFGPGGGLRGRELDAVGTATEPGSLRVVQRFEQDRVRVRFNPRIVGKNAEVWFWQRLSVLDKAPFEVGVDLGDTSRFKGGPVTVEVEVRGWSFSRHPTDDVDHQVDLLWNGEAVGSVQWNGQETRTLLVEDLPARLLKPGENRLALRVPPRRNARDQIVVDVSLLNWIRITHPFDGHLEAGQLAIEVEAGKLRLDEPTASKATLYSFHGERLPVPAGTRDMPLGFAQDGPALLLVGEAEAPDALRPVELQNLRDPARQADYLMIAHGSLLEAARPLADFHRDQGLTVALVDVQHIYDEFNHGVLSPYAIREFIAHAYHHWQSPRARFVLLVGDASWENRDGSADDSEYADWTFQSVEARTGRFVRNSSTPYANLGQSRNLVPTLQAETWEGRAASDSALVEVDGDDMYPDLAIGRLPVVTPEEVAGIVDKLIDYQRSAPVGPWRRNLLWIANEEVRMQRFTDQAASHASGLGLAPVKVYPEAGGEDNARYQRELMDLFDDGKLLVHFFGHGGRYIWRTGPPDPRKNHDLFTLDHLEQLQPNRRLPLVLSMTCYSAPFDHPTADSIGEKFLRLEDRGAIGVLAASWRNSPTRQFSEAVISELTEPAATVGEAIMNAKRVTRDPVLVRTYNYLGDPATRLQLPSRRLTGHLAWRDDALQLRIDLPDGDPLRSASAMIDYFDADGKLLGNHSASLTDGQLRLDPAETPDLSQATALSVYVWNEAKGEDGQWLVPLGLEAAGKEFEIAPLSPTPASGRP